MEFHLPDYFALGTLGAQPKIRFLIGSGFFIAAVFFLFRLRLPKFSRFKAWMLGLRVTSSVVCRSTVHAGVFNKVRELEPFLFGTEDFFERFFEDEGPSYLRLVPKVLRFPRSFVEFLWDRLPV